MTAMMQILAAAGVVVEPDFSIVYSRSNNSAGVTCNFAIQAGDLVISSFMLWEMFTGTSTVTGPPAGFTQLASTDNGATLSILNAVAYKVAVGTEYAETFTWSYTAPLSMKNSYLFIIRRKAGAISTVTTADTVTMNTDSPTAKTIYGYNKTTPHLQLALVTTVDTSGVTMSTTDTSKVEIVDNMPYTDTQTKLMLNWAADDTQDVDVSIGVPDTGTLHCLYGARFTFT